MTLSKAQRKNRMLGIPSAESTRNIGERPPTQRKPQWIPAEQAAVVQILSEILEEIKKLRKDRKK